MPTTDFPAMLVVQTMLPSTSCRTKSPVAVKFSIALSLTGLSLLADQTTLYSPWDFVIGHKIMVKK
ncbi:hypothetical protein HanPSC8_Chr13g0546001 [Helianthus annuus]|nr:hypothetical protein HanPSC8_Chr13g0546001 [Helianthus annuus]